MNRNRFRPQTVRLLQFCCTAFSHKSGAKDSGGRPSTEYTGSHGPAARASSAAGSRGQGRAGGATSIDGGSHGESSQSCSCRASSQWRLRRRQPAAVGMHGLPWTGGKCFVGGGLAARADQAERPRVLRETSIDGSGRGAWELSQSRRRSGVVGVAAETATAGRRRWRARADQVERPHVLKSMTERRNNELCKLL
jgi:hypothetical protein